MDERAMNTPENAAKAKSGGTLLCTFDGSIMSATGPFHAGREAEGKVPHWRATCWKCGSTYCIDVAKAMTRPDRTADRVGGRERGDK